MNLAQREILWNIPDAVMNGFYVLYALAVAWIVLWYVKRRVKWFRGWKQTSSNLSTGFKRLFYSLVTHNNLKRDPYAKWMHRNIFWGFVILLIATTLVAIQHYLGWIFLVGDFYLWFSLIADLGGVVFCVGLGMALYRRHTPKAKQRIQKNAATTMLLWLLLIIGLSGFVIEGARIARDFPVFEIWSPVGYLFALALSGLGLGGENSLNFHLGLWIFHAVLVGAFFIAIPVTMLRHIFLAPYTVLKPAATLGMLSTPGSPALAETTFQDFRQTDLLQADACLTCGMCDEVCPAAAAGKPLSPRSIILGLRSTLDKDGDGFEKHISDDALWSCTTCNACDYACPIHIHILDKIVTLRRGKLAEGKIPDTASEALESTAQKFNPFGKPNSSRMEWAGGLNVPVAREEEQVELLYWVGCGGAFDPAGRQISHAMIQILNLLKTNYKVLGCNERCTGDPARRLGEEGLWENLSSHNQKSFSKHKVKTILTTCPHCFHSFKNEYANPMPRVVHHSQWLKEQMELGTLQVKKSNSEEFTFHDPCYLGRVNGEVTAPRKILDNLGTTKEMEKNKENSFCCGGGGGQMWLDVRGTTRVETIRASHVEDTKVKTVATACPYCKVMVEAGRTGLEEGKGLWRVKDIAELVVENMV